MNVATKLIEPHTFMFPDDGSIPNNPHLPFLVYRGGADLKGNPNPEEIIEGMFKHNGWGEMWRNGIYAYPHYHSMIHEAMGIARGRARVRFGGKFGQEVALEAGDIMVLPAGTGHQCLSASTDLMVIGAYPPGGAFDLCRGSKAEHAKALVAIAKVPLPPSDPVYGKGGPLMRLWRA